MDEEMIVKLRDAKSVEEILAVGKEYGKEFTEEQAKELLEMTSNATGELSDEELEAVAGGGIIDTVKEWFGSLFGK